MPQTYMPGFWFKTNGGEEPFTEGDVYCHCPGCGREHIVNLIVLAREYPNFDVRNGEIHCETCSGRKWLRPDDDGICVSEVRDNLVSAIDDNPLMGPLEGAHVTGDNQVTAYHGNSAYVFTIEKGPKQIKKGTGP